MPAHMARRSHLVFGMSSWDAEPGETIEGWTEEEAAEVMPSFARDVAMGFDDECAARVTLEDHIGRSLTASERAAWVLALADARRVVS